MEYLLQMLYQQYFKDNTRTLRLLRLELGNLLALLRDSQHQSEPERTAQLASRPEQLFANLGTPTALAEVTASRTRRTGPAGLEPGALRHRAAAHRTAAR